jgi:hypothetical protein
MYQIADNIVALHFFGIDIVFGKLDVGFLLFWSDAHRND